jgi:hypothetical protein
MSVFRSCAVAVCVIAVLVPATLSGQTTEGELQQSRPVVRQEIVRQAELAVLRQKVSMPLDRLVQPISLAEWRNAATIAPQVSTVTPRQSAGVLPSPVDVAPVAQAPEQASAAMPAVDASTNPFADDPAPQSEGKIPSGKLMGIVGRALFESAPVPSLEGLREKLPNVPIPAGGAAPPANQDDFDAEPSFAPTDESDPFAEPAAAPATEESGSESTTAEEDPFG